MSETTAPDSPGYRRDDFRARMLDDLFASFGGRELDVPDMGPGTSRDRVEVLRKSPRVRYTGVEHREQSLARARKRLAAYPET